MKSRIATLLALLVCAGCSALTAQQETVLSNQVANIQSFRLDYAALDCQGCADCDAMKNAVTVAATAAGSFDAFKDTKEAQVKRYLAALRQSLPNGVPQSCTCPQDAALCPSALTVLKVSLQNIDTLATSLGIPGLGISFIRGIGDGLTGR